MHGLKSFVCKLKKKATFPHPSVPDNDVFEEIGVRPIFFEPRIIYFWMVGHAGWRSNGEKKQQKQEHVVSRRGVVGDQEKGTSASNFYIFQNKHHRCFFSHRKRQHTKGNMAGNTTWHRHAWVVGSNDQTTAMQEEWCLHGNQFSLLLNSDYS